MTRRVAVLLVLCWLAWAVSLDARVGGGSSFGSRSSSSRSYSSGSRSYSSGHSSSRSYGGSSYSSSRSYRSSGSSYSSGGGSSVFSGGGSSYRDTSDVVGFLLGALVVAGTICIVILIGMYVIEYIKANYSLPSLEVGWGAPAKTFESLEQRAATVSSSLARLRLHDANFSYPLFLDFAQLLYTRGVQARATGQVGSLAHYLTHAVASSWTEKRCDAVEEIVVGKLQIVDVRFGAQVRLTIEVDASMVEVSGDRKDAIWVAERWVLARDLKVLSGGPAKMRSLACPSCGAPSEQKPDGSCAYCGQVTNHGKFQWIVESASVTERGARPDPSDLLGGGEEVGTDKVTLRPRDFAARKRAFRGRHPDFDWGIFEQHVRRVFLALQAAWSEGREDRLRQYETDNLFATHRYWLERYRGAGLENKLDRVMIERVKEVSYDIDAFYESITVRIHASMFDYTVDASGKVLAGSASEQRHFSEYWTFIACVGHADKPPLDASCPSCGATLALSHTGKCEHCDAVVTSGEFGWVLSRIDQDEVYTG